MTDVVFTFGPGDSFFFESQTCWRLRALPPKLQVKFMAGSSDIAHVYQLALGSNDSWFVSYKTKDGGSSFSHDGLPEKLAAWLRIRDERGFTVRNVPQLKVVLGPANQSFWAEDGRDYYWDNLPTALEAAVQRLINPSSGWTRTPRIVSLGVYQSYVLVTEGGGGSFAVSDYYPFLQKELDSLIKSGKPGALKAIHHISMDPHDRDNFVLTTVYGDVYYYIPDSLDPEMNFIRGTIPRTPAGVVNNSSSETMSAPIAERTGFVQVATPPGSGVNMHQPPPIPAALAQYAQIPTPASASQIPPPPEAGYQHPHITALETAALHQSMISSAQTQEAGTVASGGSQPPSVLTPASSAPPQIQAPQASHVQMDPTTGQPVQRIVSPLQSVSPTQSQQSHAQSHAHSQAQGGAQSPVPLASVGGASAPPSHAQSASPIQQFVQEQQKLYSDSVASMHGSAPPSEVSAAQTQDARSQVQSHASLPHQSPVQQPPAQQSPVQQPQLQQPQVQQTPTQTQAQVQQPHVQQPLVQQPQSQPQSPTPSHPQMQPQAFLPASNTTGLARHASVAAPIPVSTLTDQYGQPQAQAPGYMPMPGATPAAFSPMPAMVAPGTLTQSPVQTQQVASAGQVAGQPPQAIGQNAHAAGSQVTIQTAGGTQHLAPPAPPSPSDSAPEVVTPGYEYRPNNTSYPEVVQSPAQASAQWQHQPQSGQQSHSSNLVQSPASAHSPHNSMHYRQPSVSSATGSQTANTLIAPPPTRSSYSSAGRPTTQMSSADSFERYQQVQQIRPMSQQVSISSQSYGGDRYSSSAGPTPINAYQAVEQDRPYSHVFQPTNTAPNAGVFQGLNQYPQQPQHTVARRPAPTPAPQPAPVPQPTPAPQSVQGQSVLVYNPQTQQYQYAIIPHFQPAIAPPPPEQQASTPSVVSIPGSVPPTVPPYLPVATPAPAPVPLHTLPYPPSPAPQTTTHPRTYSTSSMPSGVHTESMPPQQAQAQAQQVYHQQQAQQVQQMQQQMYQQQQQQQYQTAGQGQQQAPQSTVQPQAAVPSQGQSQYLPQAQTVQQPQQVQQTQQPQQVQQPQQAQQSQHQVPSPAPSAPAAIAPVPNAANKPSTPASSPPPVASPAAAMPRHNSYSGAVGGPGTTRDSTAEAAKSMLNSFGKGMKNTFNRAQKAVNPKTAAAAGAGGLALGVAALKLSSKQHHGGHGGHHAGGGHAAGAQTGDTVIVEENTTIVDENVDTTNVDVSNTDVSNVDLSGAADAASGGDGGFLQTLLNANFAQNQMAQMGQDNSMGLIDGTTYTYDWAI